jgi:hypothetical protein
MDKTNFLHPTIKGEMGLTEFINLVGGAGSASVDLIKLFATVSWLYRGVTLLENGVAAMPFSIRRGESVLYEYDPNSANQTMPPRGLEFLIDIPDLSGMIEGAAVLRGKAYIFNKRNRAKTLDLQWLLPDSIEPEYDTNGDLISFTRTVNGKEKPLEVEDTLYFWPKDKFVETGPAENFPGKAALHAAGVLHSMDTFLKGYFDKGMLSVGFLKYKDQLRDSEAELVKEWWKRLTTGVKRAFEQLVMRGDFEYVKIGDGLKDIENTALTEEERQSIATALGIPQSKLSANASNFATKQSDDLMFITDTIIPACNWIGKVWNKQYLMPQNLMLVYEPQKLAIMQEDEVKRGQAFVNYRNGGYTIEETESILGIYIPEDVKNEANRQREENKQRMQQNFAQNGSQNTNDDENEKKLFDLLDLLDKRDEKQQFERWLKNRNYEQIDVDEFKTQYLTKSEKLQIAFKSVPRKAQSTRLNSLVDEYGENLARFINNNINQTRNEFKFGFLDVVESGLTKIFRNAVNVPDDEQLNEAEQSEFDALLQSQIDAADGFVNDIFDTKGFMLDALRENLQEQGRNLGQRLVMWTNAARQLFNRGLIVGRREIEMTWRLGQTEEHCSDCLRFNGRKASKSDWLKLAGVGLYPQSRQLECKGYNCDCYMEFE